MPHADTTATPNNKHHAPITATLFGAASAGALEMGIFFTPEAISRRLQTNRTKLYTPGTSATIFLKNFNGAIWPDLQPGESKIRNLYSGLGIGLVYKMAQRTYKLAGQPIIKNSFNTSVGESWRAKLGERRGNLALEAVAGMLVGAGEAPLLLPLDAYKIQKQTNATALKNTSFLTVLKTERIALYNGLTWTMSRNIIGSGTLFTTKAALRNDKIDKKSYSLGQSIVSSSIAATMSIITTNPLDVVKTRVQSKKWMDADGKSLKGLAIARQTLLTEGSSAFFKGTITKVLTAGPKVAFAMTTAEQIEEFVVKKMRS